MEKNYTKSQRPKVSIIVTSYNVENYIEGCLNDIINQTLKDIEIIVVDDGSSDATPHIVKTIAAKDSRIRPIFFEKNTIGGVASAANAGIKAARGEYIGFADGDDVYYAHMFEQLYMAAKDKDADISMCNYKLLDAKSGEISDPADIDRWKSRKAKAHLKLDHQSRKEILRFISVPWRKIYRREMLMQHDLLFPVTDHFFEDNPFHWFTTLKAEDIVLINEHLCEHRVSRTGQTMVSSDRSLFGIFVHHKTIREWLLAEGLQTKYKLPLFVWLSAQIAWTSSKVGGEFVSEYFEIASSEVKCYSPRFMRSALRREEDIGYFSRLRMYFLSTENEHGFLRHRDPGKNFSLLYQAYLHIQIYGLVELIKTAPGFLIEEYFPKLKFKLQPRASGNDHVVSSLLILEERLRRIEQRMDDTK